MPETETPMLALPPMERFSEVLFLAHNHHYKHLNFFSFSFIFRELA
jgi:hypothetical protein